ncbi:MAG: serpin family protein [Proteobacteria bacterium]|nr:serpin family protein [Pseudomonadota bacterium]
MSRSSQLIRFGMCALLLAGCEGGETGEVYEGDLVAAEAALTASEVPTVRDADMEAFGKALNAFSHEFERAADLNGSYVFSPFSYHSALSMTAYGAKGTTYDEMAKVLHLSGDKETAAALNGGMRLKLRYDGQAEKSRFEIANRIWVDQSSAIEPDFSAGMDKYYKAPLKVVDFRHEYAKYVGVINTWVSNNTGKMIPKLLSEGALSPDTRLVLVNAVHFDGEWASKFDAIRTFDDKFTSRGRALDVRMMDLDAHAFVYYRSDEHKYQTASMDYKDGKFAMLIVLPDAPDGLPDVAATLDAAELRKILDGQDWHAGNILLPKFKVETEIADEVNQKAFESLGMSLAFSGAADFSGMVSNQSVLISKIVHKAVIDVDEAGTKAAAATAIVVGAMAGDISEDFIKFHADHPFAFFLYHKASGSVLFAGQYWGD